MEITAGKFLFYKLMKRGLETMITQWTDEDQSEGGETKKNVEEYLKKT